MLQSIIFWDNAHYTQNHNYAILTGALSKKMETHPKIKERPFTEGSKDYSCAIAFYFNKTEVLKI